MSTEQERYLQAIGQRVLQEMQAEQAAQPAPMDTQTAQQQRNWQIMAERNQAKQQREHEEAVKRDQETQAAQQKKRDDQQKADAVQLESSMRQEEYTKFLQAGNHPDRFESYWKETFPMLMQERRQAIELRYRQTSPAYGAI